MDLHGITAVVRGELPAWREGMGLLAGGTWLFSEPQPGLNALVDLMSLGWAPLVTGAAGLRIAATCRIAELARYPGCALFLPCCEALLGSFKIWNAATVGGNICLALPAGPMTALATALDGIATIWCPGGGSRQMPVCDLVIGERRTALAPGEILREILLPATALGRRSAFRRQSLTPLGRSAALLIGTRGGDGGFALTVTAATARPVRFDFAGLPRADRLADAIESGITETGLWFEDIHGAADWRRQLTLHFAEAIRQELAG